MVKQKLKIGLLLDDHTIPAWAYKMVEMISISYHSEITLVVRKVNVGKGKEPSILRKIWANRNAILYNLYSKFDSKLFKLKPDAFKKKSI